MAQAGATRAFGAPTVRLALALGVALTIAVLAWRATIDQPAFVIAPEAGAQISAAGRALTLEALDLTPEPSELATYEALDRFYTRQDQLDAIQTTPGARLSPADGGPPAPARPRTPGDTPLLFWIQIVVGVGAVTISGWIWALRPRDLASRLFVFSGLSTLAFTASAAVYSTRALALPSAEIKALSLVNMIGASAFGVAMIGLFLVYPRRLPAWRPLMTASALVFGLWTLLAALRWLPSPQLGGGLCTLVEMVFIVVAIAAQHRATRALPRERAALTWLGLSVMIGAGAFILLSAAPSVLGLNLPMAQGYAFLFFLIIYLGLAAGLRRYRLLNVGQWGARAMFYTLGAVLVLGLDGVMALALNIDRAPAFGLAVLGVSLAYLPLRDQLWRWTTRRRPVQTHDLLGAALDVAFATDAQRAERWISLLRRFFDPLTIEPADVDIQTVRADDEGLILYLPAVAGAGALKIAYPAGGRALFRPDDLKLAEQLIDLTRRAEQSRQAYDRGVAEERRRIAQDLHDDVGARLLTAMSRADEAIKPTLQAAISDVRTIVSGITGEHAPLDRLIADLRHETQGRLDAAGIALDWPLSDATQGRLLDWRQHRALGSCMREAISNTIRHAGARRLTVTVGTQGEMLGIALADDGVGAAASALAGNTGGFGLRSLSRRMAEIGGRFEIAAGPDGTTVRLTAPLRLGDPLQ